MVVCTNAMFLLSSKRLKKNPNPTGLCSSRNPKKTRAYARRSDEACRKKKDYPDSAPFSLRLGQWFVRSSNNTASYADYNPKVRKLKGSQSLYQNSPSEDKEYCLNDISAIKSRLHHISLFNNSIINFFHKTGQDFFSYLLVQC